jgi:hypothetical protein
MVFQRRLMENDTKKINPNEELATLLDRRRASKRKKKK